MKNINNAFMDRLEMLVISVETHIAHDMEIPRAAIQLVDVLGPLLVENIRKAKGWTHLQTAHALITQRDDVYRKSGMKAPDADMRELFDALMSLTAKPKADKAGK